MKTSGLLLVVAGCLIALAAVANADPVVVFQDDFESYGAGSFPSPNWWLMYDGAGAQYQVVVDTGAYSGNKCMQMRGRDWWAADVAHDLNLPPSIDIMWFEICIKTPSALSSYEHDDCGFNLGYRAVGYSNYTGYLNVDMLLAQPGTWYKMKVKIDARSHTADYWINDVLMRQNVPWVGDFTGFSRVTMHAGYEINTFYYFDDVKIWYDDEPPTPNGYALGLLVKDTTNLDAEEQAAYNFAWTHGYTIEKMAPGTILANPSILDQVDVFWATCNSEPSGFNDPTIINALKSQIEGGKGLLMFWYGNYVAQYLGYGTVGRGDDWGPAVSDHNYWVSDVSSHPVFTTLADWIPPSGPPDDETKLLWYVEAGYIEGGPNFSYSIPTSDYQYAHVWASYGWPNQSPNPDLCDQYGIMCTSERGIYISQIGEGIAGCGRVMMTPTTMAGGDHWHYGAMGFQMVDNMLTYLAQGGTCQADRLILPEQKTCLSPGNTITINVPVYAAVDGSVCGIQIPLEWAAATDYSLIDVSFEGTALESWQYMAVTINNDNNTVIFGGANGNGSPLMPGDSRLIAYLQFEWPGVCSPTEEFFITFDTTTIGPSSLVFADCDDPPITFVPEVEFNETTVLGYMAGDASSDCAVNVGDAVMLINYIFKGGSEPIPLDAGDANGDCDINVGDVVGLINYIFKGGSAPVCGCVSGGGGACCGGGIVALKSIAADLDAGNNGETTVVTIESPINLYGLQLEIACTSSDGIVNLVEHTQLYAGQNNSLVSVGILDLDGNGYVPAGKTTILEIPGDAHVISGLGADEFGNTFEITINQTSRMLPGSFHLAQNHPNPFNPATTVSYTLPEQAEVILDIFNVAGQRVKRLVSALQEAGEHSVIWDSRDDNGQTVASGIYLYRIATGDFTATKKMILLK